MRPEISGAEVVEFLGSFVEVFREDGGTCSRTGCSKAAIVGCRAVWNSKTPVNWSLCPDHLAEMRSGKLARDYLDDLLAQAKADRAAELAAKGQAS